MHPGYLSDAFKDMFHFIARLATHKIGRELSNSSILLVESSGNLYPRSTELFVINKGVAHFVPQLFYKNI